LSVLKEADLIRDRREGKFIYYELNASVLEEILLWVKDLKGESEENEEAAERK
jgi:DNA-binding transcriptional ArsR family regulator